jgi:23S rRNA pseudouridine1911/1915/1917 synthase
MDYIYKKIKIIADKRNNLLRIDKLLMSYLNHITRNQINKSITKGNILVNNHIIKSNYQVSSYDIIEIKYNYIIYENIVSTNIPIDIIYEDKYIMIINKIAGMVVHPGNGYSSGTLVNALKFYYEKNNITIPIRMGLVHRIDKDTSGLIIIAKNNNIFQYFTNQFNNRMIKKIYLLLVFGAFKDKTGVIDGYILRNNIKRRSMDVLSYSYKGKYAITYYKILENFNYVTFLSCYLESGRTHQIRAHFKSINHPLFNDYLYGGNIIPNIQINYKKFIKNCFLSLPRHALHSYNINFIHPINKKKCFFQSNLPNDISITLSKWRKVF